MIDLSLWTPSILGSGCRELRHDIANANRGHLVLYVQFMAFFLFACLHSLNAPLSFLLRRALSHTTLKRAHDTIALHNTLYHDTGLVGVKSQDFKHPITTEIREIRIPRVYDLGVRG
jgi:hypothetical protein